MTEKLMSIVQSVAASLENFGTGAYLLVSLLVLAETIVVIGQFIPGSVFLVFVGFLCYMQVFDLGAMITSVFISHYIGEAINYTLGRTKGRGLFREESRFFRPALLEIAERRFESGGGSLLIFGQFLGMLRPIISLAAGIAHYSPLRFFFFIGIGGLIWSSLPLVLGFFFGASWQQAVRYLEGFSTILLVGIPTVFLSAWLIRHLAENAGTLARLFEGFARRVHRSPRYLQLAQRHPRLFEFFERRMSLSQPWGLRATLGWLASALCMFLFLVVLLQLRFGDRWRDVDLSVINLLAQIRAAAPDAFIEFMAHLGDGPVIAFAATVAGIFCLHARQMKSLVVIVGSIVLAAVLSQLIRLGYLAARPDVAGPLMAQGGYSFLTGHFAVSAAMFVALYYWLWNHPGRLRLRLLLAFIVATLTALVGFSRLYFGMHFPSDVAAGFLLGLAVVIAMATYAANSEALIDIPRRADLAALVVVTVLMVAAAIYGRYVEQEARPPQPAASITAPTPVLASRDLAKAAILAAPRSSQTLLDLASFPTNLLVIPPQIMETEPHSWQQSELQPSDLSTTLPRSLAQRLEESGWRPVPPYAFFTRGIATPIFPAFVRGVPAHATFELRSPDQNTSRSVLRLWRLHILDADRPVWIGSVINEVRRERAFGFPGYLFDPDVDLALDHFARTVTAPLPSAIVPRFRDRGLYTWKRQFFTHGQALLIDLSGGG